jgi:hypothetical protein
MARWFHYVGGFYDTDKFIVEAQRLGVSRRIAPQMAKSLKYGDTVGLLKYGGNGIVTIIAEFRVEKLTLDSEIAQEVGAQLVAQGQAHYSEGGKRVVRECGNYETGGTWYVDADLSEIVEMASEIAREKGDKLSLLIGGPLIQVLNPPVLLQPAPPFTRGFMRCRDETGFEFEGASEQKMVALIDYRKRKRKRRRDLQMALPAFA